MVSQLVDPASSHMLVSKIKPCTCKFMSSERRNCEWLIKTVIFHLAFILIWITVVILELIHALMSDSRRAAFIRYKTSPGPPGVTGDSQ